MKFGDFRRNFGQVMGVPPKSILDQSTRKKMFFDSMGNPRIVRTAPSSCCCYCCCS